MAQTARDNMLVEAPGGEPSRPAPIWFRTLGRRSAIVAAVVVAAVLVVVTVLLVITVAAAEETEPVGRPVAESTGGDVNPWAAGNAAAARYLGDLGRECVSGGASCTPAAGG